jgi:hypothetical protein
MSEHKVKEAVKAALVAEGEQVVNGHDGPSEASESGLAQAMQGHLKALVRRQTKPNGQIAIEVLQMFVDLEVMRAKMEVLTEYLCEIGADPVDLVVRLRERLLLKTAQIEEELKGPRLLVPPGAANG